MNELQKMINEAHNYKLSEKIGSVYQIWDDGEITLQKSGNLLWQRSLHSMKSGIRVIEDIEWPYKMGKHGYAFVTREDAESIRERIGTVAIMEIRVKMK